MTLSVQHQTSILQLVLAMFNTAPGAVNLMILGTRLQNGQALASVAQALSESALFFDKHYAEHLSPATFAAKFVNDLIGNRASTGNKTFVIDYIANKMTAGATQSELIAELTGSLSSISPSDPNWGKASLHHVTHNATKVVKNLLGNTFTPANISVVVDYMLAQMAAGKTFGEMIVWAIDTLAGVDRDNVVWGDAAVIFNNRIEVAKYYSVDKASTFIDAITLRHILAKVTVDTDSVAAAKVEIDNFLNQNFDVPNNHDHELKLDTALLTERSNSLSILQKAPSPAELIV